VDRAEVVVVAGAAAGRIAVYTWQAVGGMAAAQGQVREVQVRWRRTAGGAGGVAGARRCIPKRQAQVSGGMQRPRQAVWW